MCDAALKTHPAYSDYATLMKAEWNSCTDDFTYEESGYCYPIQPTDAIKEAEPGKQPIYSNSTFLVCAPRGKFLAFPMPDVEIVPKAEE